MHQANVVIIGGGVVGCAVARAVSEQWSDVFLLEAFPKIGMATSTRNSGVIHSGLYYTPGSLKARHCVQGNRLTYEFCSKHGVPHRNTGKIVVASSEHEVDTLLELMKTGTANSVEGLRLIDQAEIRKREPHVEGYQAIEVPSTGILSSEDLVKAYARAAIDRGAHLVTNARVERLESAPGCIRVTSAAGDIETRCLINSAGLFADEVAAMLGSRMASHRIYPVRGEYCEVVRSKQDLVRGLVYPIPHTDGLGLGVHLTKTLSGNVLLGPTARYVPDKNDYERDRQSVELFAQGARTLLPELNACDLVPAYSGIRAKLIPPPNSPERKSYPNGMADFIIQRDPEFPNVVQLIGIESPGLTSAASIAQQVQGFVAEILG